MPQREAQAPTSGMCGSTVRPHKSVWRTDRSLANLSVVTTEQMRRWPLKVYGISEIARALDAEPGLVGKWRERHKLPAPDAELATGPVWLAETIEPLLAAGGPAARPPGQRLRTFRVTARMTAGPYPALTNARRSSFQAAIAATHRTGYLKRPAARWDQLDEATVTIECEAHDPAAAAETVRSIIRRNAEFVAQIGVREIEVVKISPADRP